MNRLKFKEKKSKSSTSLLDLNTMIPDDDALSAL